MSECGKLELIIAPMFSGKSTELLRRISRAETYMSVCRIHYLNNNLN
jgi:hypothetical protein